MQFPLSSSLQSKSEEARPLILAIRSVHLGDQRQVEAVAHELASMLNGETEFISARLRRRLYSGPTRLALHLGLFHRCVLPQAVLRWIWKKLFRGSPLPRRKPAIICSTLIPAEIPGAVLAQWSKATRVHLARPERLGRSWFSALIAPQGLEPKASDIVVSQAPTVLTKHDIEEAGCEFVQEHQLAKAKLWDVTGGWKWRRLSVAEPGLCSFGSANQ